MREVVRDAFLKLTVDFEGGYILHMFPDVKKLISGGFGLLLDPVELALTVPWRRPDGSLATHPEVISQWSQLKNYVLDHPGSEFESWTKFADKTSLRVTPTDMDAVVKAKVAQNEAVLREGFPDYEDWCADAQLGVLSQAWAQGPAFFKPEAGRRYWPKLTAALRERNFAEYEPDEDGKPKLVGGAAFHCFMNEEKKNPGIIPRNKANKILFQNAAIVAAEMDPDTLYYPRDLRTIGVDPVKDFDTVTKSPFDED